MAPGKAISEQDRLQPQARFHRTMNAGPLGTLFFGVLLLGFIIMHDTTKIVPPEVKRPYEIRSNYANKGYLLDVAGYALGTVLIVTPEAVDYNNKMVLKMTDPDGYAGLKTVLDAAAIWFRQERVTTVWVPYKEEISGRSKRVEANGKLKTSTADKLVSEREKDYPIEFTITTSGRLCVSKIEEIVKRDPSTNKPAGN